MNASSPADAGDDIFVGDSEMARRMRDHDWDSTPLGPPAQWPGALKSAVRLMLEARFLIAMSWGPEATFLYNDAYRPTLGIKHPEALGLPMREIWGEIWPSIGPDFRQVYEQGTSVFRSASLLLMERHGFLEETYYTYSYSPLRDDDGTVGGLLIIAVDDTDRIISERRLATLRDLAGGLAVADSRAAVLAAVEETLRHNPRDLPFGLAYLFEEDGSAALACTTGLDARHPLAPARLRRETDAPWTLETLRQASGVKLLEIDHLPDRPAGAWEIPPGKAALLPIAGQGTEQPAGALIVGLNPFRPVDEAYLGFLRLLAGQIASSLAGAEAFEAERRRVAALAEAARLRQEAAETLRLVNEQLEQRVARRTEELAEALEKLRRESEERAAAEAALRHAQKIEALGKLTGGIAHDFNNLLQVISGNLQLLSGDIHDNERAQRRVASALAGVTRGAKLAAQLLAFGRRQPLAPKVVNIGRLILNMDDMLRRALGEEIEIATEISGGLWNTLVDPGQIENALINLAINGRDAMNGGGRLTIEARNATLDDDYARSHEDVRPGQYVMVAVGDTGSGIAPDVLDHVFEPFFSTKPEGQGTGLGLSMVHGFVRQSGGHVKIDSRMGEGTTVRIYLPRALQNEDVLADAAAAPVRGGSETILVVEDDEEVRETTVSLLADLGYRVLKAKDAASALTVIESGVPVDLLFTDVVMPGPLRSPELARMARERLPHLAVLFASGYTQDVIFHDGRLDPGVELLSKPYSREALARKIREVLASHARPRQTRARDARSGPAAPQARPAMTVLLVEDEGLIRTWTAEMLAELGHEVVEAGTAEEALQALETTAIDFLLTDVGLPAASGIELALAARQQQPDLPVVFSSGGDAVPASVGLGPCLTLLKPYTADELARALTETLRQGEHVSTEG